MKIVTAALSKVPTTGVEGANENSTLRRNRIVEAGIALARDDQDAELTIASVATAVGIAAAELQADFPTSDSLVAAVLTRWQEQRLEPLIQVAIDHGTVAFLHAVVASNVKDPGLIRLLLSAITAGARRTHPASVFYRDQYEHFCRLLRRFLTADIQQGREPSTMDPERGAEQLLAVYEGLQLQAMLRERVDLVGSFDRAATRLRRGWSEPYRPGDIVDIPYASDAGYQV